MAGRPFSLWDAFAEAPFGGSQAAVVEEAGGIDTDTRFRIALELGLPATAFIDAAGPGRVEAQFFSAVAELPMCGHGTLCLMSHLVTEGHVTAPGAVDLVLPAGTARVDLSRREDGRVEVMLEMTPPTFSSAEVDMDTLFDLLGAPGGVPAPDLPVEVATGDFIHLVLPLPDLAAMRALAPEFSGLAAFFRANGLETVVAFSTETEDPAATLHVRDFCPAVGVAESASAGTTNAALAAYLWRHGQLAPGADRQVTVLAEQGLEIGRASRVRSMLETRGRRITRLATGGVAARLARGVLEAS